MDYWERKDRKTQLENLSKRNRQGYAGGGSVQQVAPGIYSPMAPGETMRTDEQGKRIYSPPDRPPSPPPPDPAISDDIIGGIKTN